MIDTAANDIDSAVANSISFDDFLALRASVKVSGRAGANYLISPNTEATLMGIKDADGRPLWAQSVRNDEPGLIWGQAYLLSDFMNDVATGDKAVFYGAIRKYITNYVRRDMSLRTLRELFSANGRIGYRGQMRHDMVNELPEGFATLTIA